jgi:hypothetical protein
MRHTAFACLLLPGLHLAAQAAPYTGPDYSGVYDCKGQDSHEGPYTGTVEFALVKAQSSANHGAYSFKLQVPGYGTYPGHAAAKGNMVAIYFALTDPSTKDYGTGIAAFSKSRQGKWQFEKYYYEPEFKGGNWGTELCIQR